MSFYQLLQLNPGDLKKQIKDADSHKYCLKACIAIVVRAILIVLFAMVLIAPLTPIFGVENNAMLVVVFCIILSIRFVDFGYNIKASVINMGLTFFLLAGGPILANFVHPLVGVLVNFVSLLLILIMTTKEPLMGNGGLYGFTYVFLAGNPVSGDLAIKRFILAALCFVLCSIILYAKHKDKHQDVSFMDEINNFHLSSYKSQYQIRLALGVSLLLFIGDVFHLERFMWAGFACSSLLSTYARNEIKSRSSHRIFSTIAGTLAFLIVYSFAPTSFHTLFGPICGLCLGFCVEYRHKTTINCFSALLIATGLYGLKGALGLRIINNVLGVIFAGLFIYLFDRFLERHDFVSEQ